MIERAAASHVCPSRTTLPELFELLRIPRKVIRLVVKWRAGGDLAMLKRAVTLTSVFTSQFSHDFAIDAFREKCRSPSERRAIDSVLYARGVTWDVDDPDSVIVEAVEKI